MFENMVRDMDMFELTLLYWCIVKERCKRFQNEANNKLRQKGKWGI